MFGTVNVSTIGRRITGNGPPSFAVILIADYQIPVLRYGWPLQRVLNPVLSISLVVSTHPLSRVSHVVYLERHRQLRQHCVLASWCRCLNVG